MPKAAERAEAKSLGLPHYFTGRPCKNGHIAERRTVDGRCLKCAPDIAKRYRDLHPDRCADQRRRSKNIHGQKYKIWKREYRAGPGRLKHAADSRRRHARKRDAQGDHAAEDIQKLLDASNKCHVCGKPFTKKRPPTVDHVLAVANQGPNDPSNLALAHGDCNSRKQDSRFHPDSGQGFLI